MFEFNELRPLVEQAPDNIIRADRLGRLINPGIKGNLHDRAWDAADALVAILRGR